MSLSNITATLSNGSQIVSVANVAPAGGVSSCTDECLVLTVNNALGTNDRLNAKIEISKSVVKILDVDYAIGYGGSTSIRSQANITDSYIHWTLGTTRKDIRLTSLVNSTIRCTGGVGSRGFLITQAGNQAVLDNSVVDGIYVHQPDGAPLTFKNVTYKNCGLNFCNWDIGDITLTGVVFGSGTATGTSYIGADGKTYNTYDVWVGSGNANNKLRLLDSTLNMSKVAINLTTTAGKEIVLKSYSRTEKYASGAVALEGANVRFTPAASSGSSSQVTFDRSVNASGYLSNGEIEEKSVSLLVQNTVDSGTARTTGLIDPSATRNYTLKNIAWIRSVRRADILGVVSDVTPASKIGSITDPINIDFQKDTQFTGTVAQAAAITGVSFTVANDLVAISVSADRSGQDIYDAWKHWTSQLQNFGVPQNLITINKGELSITGRLHAEKVVSSGGNVLNIKTTDVITTSDVGGFTLPIEDVNGVRITVRKYGGGNFNIAARGGTTGTYTDLGFQSGVSNVTYTVPRGMPVEVVMWSLGYVTYTRTISTTSGGVVLEAEMVANLSINIDLDVSSYLSSIGLSLDGSSANPKFVITFLSDMRIQGIETGKALIHKLVGSEVALRAGFPPGSTSTVIINSDEITNLLPGIRLDLAAGVNDVYLGFFINTASALLINPNYIINPRRADNLRVEMLPEKLALDASVLAAGVWASNHRTLTSGAGIPRIDS